MTSLNIFLIFCVIFNYIIINSQNLVNLKLFKAPIKKLFIYSKKTEIENVNNLNCEFATINLKESDCQKIADLIITKINDHLMAIGESAEILSKINKNKGVK